MDHTLLASFLSKAVFAGRNWHRSPIALLMILVQRFVSAAWNSWRYPCSVSISWEVIVKCESTGWVMEVWTESPDWDAKEYSFCMMSRMRTVMIVAKDEILPLLWGHYIHSRVRTLVLLHVTCCSRCDHEYMYISKQCDVRYKVRTLSPECPEHL